MTAVRRREVPPVDPSILKLFVAGNKVQSGNLAMAMSGAAGMAGGAEQTLWAQNELISRYGISIGGGTNEVQRNNLAERALGLPREPGFDPNQSWNDIPRN
jgi:alkylation response protein AidB-like acyl-CoA dehydrogenase